MAWPQSRSAHAELRAFARSTRFIQKSREAPTQLSVYATCLSAAAARDTRVQLVAYRSVDSKAALGGVCREAKSGLTLSLAPYATRAPHTGDPSTCAHLYIFPLFSHAASCNLFSQRFEKAGLGARDKYPGACMRAADAKKSPPRSQSWQNSSLSHSHMCACTCKKIQTTCNVRLCRLSREFSKKKKLLRVNFYNIHLEARLERTRKNGDRCVYFLVAPGRKEAKCILSWCDIKRSARGEVVQARVIKADCLLEQRLRRSAP
jgi:hypothetical protein